MRYCVNLPTTPHKNQIKLLQKVFFLLHLTNTPSFFHVFKDFSLYVVFFFSIKVVKICKGCIEKIEPVLADTHIYLLRMWSTLSEVQAYLQYFNDAADYARKMVDGYM